MATAALPVELLIEIFELAMTNIGPDVGVSPLASQSSSGQAAPTESSNEDSDDEASDGEDSNDEDSDDGDDAGDDDDEEWDEGYSCSSSEDEYDDSGDCEISVETIQCKEDEEQGSNASGDLELRRQRDGAVEWSPLKACRL
jgi:hypothetical protein